MLNEVIATHPLQLHLRTSKKLHYFILSIAKLTSLLQQVIELTKKLRKKKKIERSETHAIKWNKWWRANSNMFHKTTAFIAFICNKTGVYEIFLKSKLQIMLLKILTSLLRCKNYFLTYPALQTLFPPNLCLLLYLSQILNIFNVLFSSSLNRLNTLSPYQIFVQIGNA